MTSLVEAFAARARDDLPGYTVDGLTTPWDRVVAESSSRAEIVRNFLGPFRPQNFGVLVDSAVEHLHWLGAALLSGACMTGLDLRRHSSVDGSAIRRARPQFIVVDEAGFDRLDELDLDAARIVDLKSDQYLVFIEHARRASVAEADCADGGSLCRAIIDSPTFGSRSMDVSPSLAMAAALQIIRSAEVTRHDIFYDTMPLGCANSVLASWAPAVAVGSEIVFRREFSARQFLADVHDFNCTYFTFAGSMIADLLDHPESDRDLDIRLRVGVGTGTTPGQRHSFYQRFGCEIIDAGGWLPESTEVG